jgi:hypothetical protein
LVAEAAGGGVECLTGVVGRETWIGVTTFVTTGLATGVGVGVGVGLTTTWGFD